MSVLRNLRILSDSVHHFSSCNRRIQNAKAVIFCNYCKETGVKVENTTPLFFNEDVQKLLRKLTKIDYGKVFRPKKLGKKLLTPDYKFMTDEELEKAKESARKKALWILHMPPVLPPRKEINHVYVLDQKLKGYIDSKFIFTDITFGKNDRNRHIVVRDTDGTLRKASWEERERMNEIYFPREGRKLRIPKMFQSGYFENVLAKEWFEFILDRACIQFEPDDPMYIEISQRIYDKVAETGKFKELESTRHYGPLIYHLTEKENLSSLFISYLNFDRLDNIVNVIKLHEIIHPSKTCSVAFSPGQELSFVKAFIIEFYSQKSDLILTLKSYEDYLSKPKSQALA